MIEPWAIDNHQGVAVSYIDFSRAFDSVVHNKLLVKLASYGIANDLQRSSTTC